MIFVVRVWWGNRFLDSMGHPATNPFRTWKWMVGRRWTFLLGCGLFSQVRCELFVSGRVIFCCLTRDFSPWPEIVNWDGKRIPQHLLYMKVPFKKWDVTQIPTHCWFQKNHPDSVICWFTSLEISYRHTPQKKVGLEKGIFPASKDSFKKIAVILGILESWMSNFPWFPKPSGTNLPWSGASAVGWCHLQSLVLVTNAQWPCQAGAVSLPSVPRWKTNSWNLRNEAFLKGILFSAF